MDQPRALSIKAAKWDRIASELGRDADRGRLPQRMQWAVFPDTGPSERILEPYRSARVIELGCGDGSNAAYLATMGAEVTGIDFSPIRCRQNVSRWRGVSNLVFKLVAAESLHRAFPPQSFDIALSIFGALQFGDVPDVLRSVRHVLVPDGRLIFSVRALEMDEESLDAREVQRRDFVFRIPDRLESRISMWRGTIPAWVCEVEKQGFSVTDATSVCSPELMRGGERVPHTYIIRAVRDSRGCLKRSG